MTKQGWLSLHRKIKDHWLWSDKPFAKGQAWIDLLILANHDDNEFLFGNEVTKVEQGSFITSELKLMDRWGWSKTKVRAFLKLLQDEQMIVKKSDNKKTAITIVNYSVYSVYETAKKPQKDFKKTSKKLQKDTNNNDNNENNVNKDNKLSYSDVPELNDALVSFVEHRKNIKKPMSQNAVKLLIGKLNKMTTSIPEQIEILNQSIVNGWQGVFPLKEKQTNKAAYDLDAFEKVLDNKDKPKSEYNDFMSQLAAMRE